MHLSVRNITFSYRERRILKAISFEAEDRQLVSLCGDNGSGKSTLLKLLIGILQASPSTTDSPSIQLDGQELATSKVRQRLKAGFTYLPQSKALFERLTVKENIEVALSTLPSRNRRRHFEETLEILTPLQVRLKQIAGTLSGGEARTVGLAMCIATNPNVLLLDEPLAGLSRRNAQATCRVFKRVLKARKIVLVAEHRDSELTQICSSQLVLRNGALEKRKMPTRQSTMEDNERN